MTKCACHTSSHSAFRRCGAAGNCCAARGERSARVPPQPLIARAASPHAASTRTPALSPWCAPGPLENPGAFPQPPLPYGASLRRGRTGASQRRGRRGYAAARAQQWAEAVRVDGDSRSDSILPLKLRAKFVRRSAAIHYTRAARSPQGGQSPPPADAGRPLGGAGRRPAPAGRAGCWRVRALTDSHHHHAKPKTTEQS